MGTNTKIEWCDFTFNGWEGCTKVSPGCAHCYAETRNARFGGGTAPNWGKGAPRRRTSAHNWNEPRRWNKAAAVDPAAVGTDWEVASRPRVFCSSLADWLDDEVPVEWLADLLALIHETPHLDWLLLTKRPENWRAQIGNAAVALTARGVPHRLHHWQCGEAPANVWIGTTVEDQQRADERIPELVNIPARVRFLSCEPLLGPVNLSMRTHRMEMAPGIHWVICGGESGPDARPMHPDWARSLRDQCATAGVAFHFKQWGEWVQAHGFVRDMDGCFVGNLFSVEIPNNPAGIRDCICMQRIGKKAAGRLLDGVEHNGFPA